METVRIGPGVPRPRRARTLLARAVATAAWGVVAGLGAGLGVTIWVMLATAIAS